MPWKGIKNPYKIWLSEIILQQTRVEQGWAYYERFIKAFPTIHDLAKAPEKKVFKLWEGLGYYNRCKNLIATAKKISVEYKGKFPSSYEEILELKGIGPYTAAAIASFAFDQPYAVVDGNVERVLSRYFGINTPVDTNDGKKMYNLLANALLDKKKPGKYNQAIMDFGAVVCKPQNPLCEQCPQKKSCQAYHFHLTQALPVKSKKAEKKIRWFYYFIIEHQGSVWVHKRDAKDIWQNLYEFVLWETNKETAPDKVAASAFALKTFDNQKINIKNLSPVYKQQLTHQTIYTQFLWASVKKPLKTLEDYDFIKIKDLIKLPFPKTIAAYLKTNSMNEHR